MIVKMYETLNYISAHQKAEINIKLNSQLTKTHY